MNRIALACVGLWMTLGAAYAHDEGPAHHGAVATNSPDRPHRTPDGRLFLPKPMQHRLGIRTASAVDTPSPTLRLLGEVVSHPDAPGAVTAPEAGRLERAGAGWPVSGQRVKAGQELAVLRPLMSERERAQRRAALASIEQKRNLAKVNAERLQMQVGARSGAPVTENIYLEQAQTELATQERLLQLATEGLEGRVILRAMASGTLTATRARPGDVVAAGAPLFDIGGAARVRIAADTWDARLAQNIRSVHLEGEPGEASLSVRGVETQASGNGWRLLIDAPLRADRPLLPGQLVPLQAELAQAACAPGTRTVWLHVEPEWFERREVSACDAAASAPGERVVVSGAALLDEYR